jgi:tetratricopeptide (TPR) repeat protein
VVDANEFYHAGSTLPAPPKARKRNGRKAAAVTVPPKKPSFSFDDRLARGDTHYDEERYGQALAEYDAALALEPKSPVAHYGRGCALQELERTEEALSALKEALSQDPDYEDAYYALAKVYSALGQPAGTIFSWSAAIRLNPNEPSYWMERGDGYFDQERYSEALRDYDSAVRLDPTSALALLNRSWALRMVERYEEARADLEQAVLLDPDNAEVRDALADMGSALSSNSADETVAGNRHEEDAPKVTVVKVPSMKGLPPILLAILSLVLETADTTLKVLRAEAKAIIKFFRDDLGASQEEIRAIEKLLRNQSDVPAFRDLAAHLTELPPAVRKVLLKSAIEVALAGGHTDPFKQGTAEQLCELLELPIKSVDFLERELSPSSDPWGRCWAALELKEGVLKQATEVRLRHVLFVMEPRTLRGPARRLNALVDSRRKMLQTVAEEAFATSLPRPVQTTPQAAPKRPLLSFDADDLDEVALAELNLSDDLIQALRRKGVGSALGLRSLSAQDVADLDLDMAAIKARLDRLLTDCTTSVNDGLEPGICMVTPSKGQRNNDRPEAGEKSASIPRSGSPLLQPVARVQPDTKSASNSPLSKTLRTTLDMFRQGLDPSGIAKDRDLQLSTVYGHFDKLLEAGEVDFRELASPQLEREVRAAYQNGPPPMSVKEVTDRMTGKNAIPFISFVLSRLNLRLGLGNEIGARDRNFVQKSIVDAVKAHNGEFLIHELVLFLQGVKTTRSKEDPGHPFGLLRKFDREGLNQVVRRLIGEETLSQSDKRVSI